MRLAAPPGASVTGPRSAGAPGSRPAGAARPRCALCGAPVPPPFRAPPAEGSPDLDLRPGEPTRSTLSAWVAACPGCAAAAPDLAALPPEAVAALRDPAYPAAPADATLPFRRWAALCAALGDAPGRREALLQAAWAAEDAGLPHAPLRVRAAESWGRAETPESGLRLLDVLRRAGEAGAAAALADRLAASPLDETSARVLAFQRARLAQGDTGRYLLASALRPPARTPHVAHGREKGGFWRALLRRG